MTLAQRRIVSRHRATKTVALAAVAAFCYTFVATGGFYRVSHERNYYDMLADGFLAGRTSLLVEPTPELAAAYARRDYDKIGNEGVLIDTALYHGRYYLYFGPAPAVMCAAWKLAWPGATCQSVPFVVLFAVGSLVGVYFALHALERLTGTAWPFGRRLVLFCFAAAAIQFYLVGFPKIYHLSIGGGMCFTLASLAVFLWYLGGSSRPLASLFAVGSLLSLAVSSRITMVFFAAAVTAVLLWVELRRSEAAWEQRALRLVAFGAPLVVTACALLAYNWIRFGSLFEFGVAYTVTNAANSAVVDEGRTFSLGYVPQNLFWYFLYLPPISSEFPFFSLKETDTFRFHSSSAFLTGPITLLAAGAVAHLIAGRIRGVLVAAVVALATGAGATTVYILTFFGATKRYEYDFLPVWYLLAYLGLREARARWPDAPAWRVVARVTIVALVLWSTGMAVLLGATSASLEFPPYLLVEHWQRRAEALMHPTAQIPIDLGRTSGYPPAFQQIAAAAYRNDRQFVMAWQGTIVTDPVKVTAGAYDVNLEHFSYTGTPDHVYAQFEVSVEADGHAVIPLMESRRWESSPDGRIDRVASFFLPSDAAARVRISYLNDVTGTLADRNLYLTALWLRPSGSYKGSLLVEPSLTTLTGYPADWNALAVSETVRTGEFPMAWQGAVHTPPIEIPPGEYELAVEHRGTPMAGQYPVADVTLAASSVTEAVLVSQRITSSQAVRVDRSQSFHVPAQTSARITIAFVNDGGNGVEDRNFFIRRLYVMRLGNATASPSGR